MTRETRNGDVSRLEPNLLISGVKYTNFSLKDLGGTSWTSCSHRATTNEILIVLYFRTNNGLHNWAHSPAHREGWEWWNKTYKQHPHIGIMHEVYEAPKGHWENIYVNYHPSGICKC
jgi:hypothetical protein